MDSMPFNLGFQTKHILNPWSIHFNPVKVSLNGFQILFKILSEHCERQCSLKFHCTSFWLKNAILNGLYLVIEMFFIVIRLHCEKFKIIWFDIIFLFFLPFLFSRFVSFGSLQSAKFFFEKWIIQVNIWRYVIFILIIIIYKKNMIKIK